MSGFTLEEYKRAEIVREYFSTSGRAARKEIVDKHALNFGVSASTLHRKLELNIRTKIDVKPEVQGKWKQIDEYAQKIWDFAQQHSTDGNTIKLKKAFRKFEKEGLMPKYITLRNVYDAIERMNLRNLAKPAPKRHEREHPRSMYQIDFTVSRYVKYVGNGTLRICDQRYTRKDEGPDTPRVWIGGAVDDCSRVMYMEYFLVKGESSELAQEFTFNALKQKESWLHLQGLPRELYVDRGPGFKEDGFMRGIKTLGINMIFGDDLKDGAGRRLRASNKQGRGKIERMMGVVKEDFEQDLLLGLLEGVTLKEGSQVSLSELNEQLFKWVEWFNQNHHPVHRTLGKWNMFSRGLENAAFPPEYARSAFAKSDMRVVRNRLIRVGGGISCKAPEFIGELQKVQVWSEPLGNGETAYFIIHDSERYRLELQDGTPGKRHTDSAKKLNVQTVERESDMLSGLELRSRFADELETISEGAITLEALDPVLFQSLSNFFVQPKKISEIKARARYIKLRAEHDRIDDNTIDEDSIGNDEAVEYAGSVEYAEETEKFEPNYVEAIAPRTSRLPSNIIPSNTIYAKPNI